MKKLLAVLIGGLLFFFAVPSSKAASEMKMTITPPLIKNNVEKGQVWTSAIRVTNNTVDKLTVYTQVVDFKSREDGAGPEFIQKDKESSGDKYFASDWIDVPTGPIIIGPQSSQDLPLVVNVPENASPGGHYAAVMIGNKPSGEVKGTAIKTASQLASLILLSVKGDIVEKGDIREFSTDKSFYQEPKVKMTVRFSNQGNVHLQPKGEIKIFNLFNKEVGKFMINQPSSDYGNVLPESIRKWDFSWESEGILASLGRYRADLIVSYGSQGKETKNMSLFFWVINLKIVGIGLGIIILLILIVSLIIKWYVRRAVKNITGSVVPSVTPVSPDPGSEQLKTNKTVDLRNISKKD